MNRKGILRTVDQAELDLRPMHEANQKKTGGEFRARRLDHTIEIFVVHFDRHRLVGPASAQHDHFLNVASLGPVSI